MKKKKGSQLFPTYENDIWKLEKKTAKEAQLVIECQGSQRLTLASELAEADQGHDWMQTERVFLSHDKDKSSCRIRPALL